MPKKTTVLFKQFNIKIIELENIRKKYELLFNKNEISDLDISIVYSGLFIELFTEFEALLEDLFFGLLKRELYSSNPDFKIILNIKPLSKIDESVMSGLGTNKKKFLDWLPYTDYTIPRAKIYFFDGLPFSAISSIEKGNLKFYHIIRNALVHKSDYAKKKFNDQISNLTLRPKEKNPAYFLRSIPSKTTGITQYENAAEVLKNIAKIICV